MRLTRVEKIKRLLRHKEKKGRNVMKLRHSKLVVAILALVCSVTAVFGTLSVAADEEPVIPVVEQCTMGDLPYFTWKGEYKGYDLGRSKVKLMYTDSTAKYFNKDVEGYNLKDFAEKVNDNKLKLDGFTVENWKYEFPGTGGSVVAVVESKVDGTIYWDYTGVTLGGWIDWNSLYRVYKKEAATGTVTLIAEAYHKSDANELKTEVTKGVSVDVNIGDVIYYEFGADIGRNFQDFTKAKICAQMAGTSDEITDEIRKQYADKLQAQVDALNPKKYSDENWAKIEKYLSDFKAAVSGYTTLSPLMVAYNQASKDIAAVLENNIDNIKIELKAEVKNYYESLTESNYTAENWAIIKGAYDAFVGSIDALETEEEVRNLYTEKMAAMKAVKASKQSMKYLDYPSTMNKNGYSWITGEIVDTKLMTGSVANGLLEFNAKYDTEDKMYNNTLYPTGTPAAYAENWKWYVTGEAGVITVFKANVDCQITVTDIRIADGKGQNGFTDDTTLTKYIVRNGEVKKIGQIKKPTSDADFSGTYYLKAGDMLYIEFIALSTIDAGSQRNTESPYATTFLADSTAFDEEKYAEQNHDLPQEVTDLIAAKQALLDEWFATLTEADYSATNWLQVQDELKRFGEKCETEVSTTADVEALYEDVLAAAKAVKTIAQTEAELKAALEQYVAELQKEYDELVKNNHYTEENKAALDAALAKGKTEIMAAKSKSAGNTAKLKAIGALKAVETSEPKSGCSSSVASMGLGGLVLAIGAVVVALKKKTDY